MILNLIRTVVAHAVEAQPHLAEWWEGYDPAIHETQINVNKEQCNRLYQPVDGQQQRWHIPAVNWGDIPYHTREDLDEFHEHSGDDNTVYWDGPTVEIANLRIPYGSHTNNPTYYDREVEAPIHRLWDRIGTSGWNWKEKRSEWVGFDFDSVCKSKNGNGLSESHLLEITNRVRNVPWVKVRTSTGGAGLHLIAPVDEVTRNHNVHAELAKFVLEKLSKACGFEFLGSVDVYGRILWHYSKGGTDDCLRRI